MMEDAATAEISRAQIGQWLKYKAVLDNGSKATPAFFERALDGKAFTNRRYRYKDTVNEEEQAKNKTKSSVRAKVEHSSSSSVSSVSGVR